MAVKEWSTNYSGANPVQDADPVTGAQPDLDDETEVNAGDGDEMRSSQVETVRDKADAVARLAGDSVNAPAGSLADILDRDHAAGDARQVRLAERSAAPDTVAGKSFLITIGDRSVTGMVTRDQMVGPWQVPVADVAVTAVAGHVQIPLPFQGQSLSRLKARGIHLRDHRVADGQVGGFVGSAGLCRGDEQHRQRGEKRRGQHRQLQAAVEGDHSIPDVTFGEPDGDSAMARTVSLPAAVAALGGDDAAALESVRRLVRQVATTTVDVPGPTTPTEATRTASSMASE